MKTFATKEKRSARKASPYVHHPMGSAQQAAMRKILRLDEVQAKPDIGDPDSEYEQEADHVAADLPVPAISGMSGGAAPLQRSENEEPEEELQRQPEEDEEKPIQAKLIQRQPVNEEEPFQAKRIQRQMTDTRGIRPSRFGYVGPQVKAQQAEIRRILRSTDLQAKLTIGQSNDKYEQEADRVADQVMAMPDPKLQRQPENEEEEEAIQTKPLADQVTPLVQRQEETPEEEEEELQAKEMPGKTPEVTPSLDSKINSLKGGGQPLDSTTRNFFEPRIGYDFSHVRIHTGSDENRLATKLGAAAFTVGKDVVFRDAQYQPDSTESKKLLAHELTHVAQQSEKSEQPLWRSSLLQRSPSLVDPQELMLVNARPPMARDFDGGFTATVFFGRGKFFLDQPNAEAIEGIGLLLSFIPGARVLINGHASTESSSSFNETLSKNRMEMVNILLSTHSFGTLSISKDYFGENKPLVVETGTGSALEQKRQLNRRVEIMVIKPPPPPVRLFPNMVVPEVTEPKDKGEPGMTTGGETPPVPPSTYKQLEERFNKLQNNPFVKHFLAPSLEETMKHKGPFFKFKLELP